MTLAAPRAAPVPRGSGEPLLFSLVIPSRGDGSKLRTLLGGLERQTLAADRYETFLVLDGADLPPALTPEVERLGIRLERLPARAGPGAARNRGASLARGEYLAFTEDDCVPDPGWLAAAAARLEAEPALDVLEGRTRTPRGRPVRRGETGVPLYLPTNLFVRRAQFTRAGGYHEGFFDPRGGVYFREDSDLGFALEEAGARIAVEPRALVTHPDEHPRWLDPLRWARRYQMDPLLARRHPRRFRERIEVHRLGRLILRRPAVRSCFGFVVASAGALVAALAGAPALAWAFVACALLALVPVWAKWGFAPARLPLVPLVPFVLVAAWLRGWVRARRPS